MQAASEPYYVPYGPLLRATRALQNGDFSLGQRLTARAGELGRQVDSSHIAQLTLMQEFALARWLGDPSGFIEPFLSFVGETGSGPAWRCALALAEAESGHADEARASLQRALGQDGFASLPENEFWLFAMGCAAVAVEKFADQRRGREIYEALLPYQELFVGNVAPVVGPVAYAAGCAAMAAGLDREAAELLEYTVGRCENLAFRPWVVESLRALIRAQARAGLPTDELTRRCQTAVQALGIDPAGSPSRMAGGRALFGLTSREWDVLQLLLLGKSNQEISTNLYISYKTTKTHVSHILQKLGARDRADVVVIAGRQGLLGARTVE